MPTYNVLVGVVDLIDAPTKDEAVQQLRQRLLRAGFEPHDDGADAFESEEQP